MSSLDRSKWPLLLIYPRRRRCSKCGINEQSLLCKPLHLKRAACSSSCTGGHQPSAAAGGHVQDGDKKKTHVLESALSTSIQLGLGARESTGGPGLRRPEPPLLHGDTWIGGDDDASRRPATSWHAGQVRRAVHVRAM
jgi:hypothetical protein